MTNIVKEMWCVFYPTGVPVEWTIEDTEDRSKHRLIGSGDKTWDKWREQGYTCRKVEVTIKDIEK